VTGQGPKNTTILCWPQCNALAHDQHTEMLDLLIVFGWQRSWASRTGTCRTICNMFAAQQCQQLFHSKKRGADLLVGMSEIQRLPLCKDLYGP
jgi:hypothetical protein